MANKIRKPLIRFKGFTDDWEQRKLGEVAIYRRGSFPQPYGKPEWYDGEGAMPFVQVADVTENMDLVENTKQKISRIAQPLSVYAEKDSVLVTLQGTIGRVAVTQYGAYIDRTLLIFEKYKIGIDKQFWAYTIKQKFIEESRWAPGGTIKTITKEALSDFNLQLPKYDEQRSLGKFFFKIDQIITLHQRKLDKLLNIKKSMLDKMFPKNGSDKPEIRFKGFTDAWEQRKLGEVVNRVVRKNSNLESKLPLTISAQYGLVDQISYFNNRVASANLSNYYLIFRGEFAYNKSTSDGYPFGAVKKLDNYEQGALSILYIVFATKDVRSLNSDYMATYFDTDRWYKGVSERAAEGARNHGLLNISADDFFDIDVTLSNEIDEQEKIAAFIYSLNNLITLHQRKLEKLKNLKKACLERMFV